jgi:hypothetical protein
MCKYEFIQVHLGDTPHNLVESDFEYLASKTEGFSGSDIAVCVSSNFFCFLSYILQEKSFQWYDLYNFLSSKVLMQVKLDILVFANCS